MGKGMWEFFPQDANAMMVVDLGVLFYIFLGMIWVFSTNAINIYAGVNGLEAGQSLVIAVSLLCNSCLQIFRLPDDFRIGRDRHVFSVYLLLPFCASSLALLYHNWYPSAVFVGDTYCYFAGMTFAVAAILGHYSKTLMLFLAPQILNFIYGLPQLFKFIECPRHRLPAYDVKTDTNDCSMCEIDLEKLGFLGRRVFHLYKALGIVKIVEVDPPNGKKFRMSNLTLINYALHVLGPMHEKTLVIVLLAGQIGASTLAFVLRYGVSHYFYETVL